MMDPDSIDLIVTSPPYNVGINYDNKGNAADRLDLESYGSFAVDCMENAYRLLKTGGRACIEIGASGLDFPLTYIWQKAAFEAGFGLFCEIGIEHRKTNPCAWGSWLKPDNCRIIGNFHMLYVFYKETRTKRGNGSDIVSEEFVEWTRGYWKINWTQDSTRDHPAQFPLELPKRAMKLFGHVGDTVLDIFAGSGTTLIAALQHGRNPIGFELSKTYYDLALRRIETYRMQPALDFTQAA